MKQFEVVAAVMMHRDRILCVQRGEANFEYISHKWEFPGGKVEINESLENAIKREIKEELIAEITQCDAFLTVEHQYPDFHITMHSFLCDMPTTIIQLTEHIDYQWLCPEKLLSLDWAAADLPIVNKIKEEFHGSR